MVVARVAISPQWRHIWPWGHGFGLQGRFRMCCPGMAGPQQHWKEAWAKKLLNLPGDTNSDPPMLVLKDAFLLHPAPHFHSPRAGSFTWINHFSFSKNLTGGMDREDFCILAPGRIPTRWKGEGKNNDQEVFFPKNRNVTLLSSTPSVFLQQAFCALVIIYFRIAYFTSFSLHTQVGISPPTAGHCRTLYSLPALRATVPGRNLPLIK